MSSQVGKKGSLFVEKNLEKNRPVTAALLPSPQPVF